MKYIFIVNGAAGNRSTLAWLQDEINTLGQEVDYEIYETKGPKDATTYIKNVCASNTNEICFVACGGDGTINEVSSALVGEKNKFLGILACGSGNDFIKYYKDLDFKNVKKLINGTQHKIDILKVNDAYSINVCNFGFDAIVGSTANKVKLKGGKNPYGAGVRKAIFTGRFNKIDVTADGEHLTKKRMLLCTLANNSYVGGQFFCAPKSKNDDGLIDLCLFPSMTLISFLKILKPYTNGKHLDNPKISKKCIYRKVKHVEVNSKKNIELCLDGEMLGGNHFEIDILPSAVNIILPEA